jgi:8-oxo-dGTP pyrophosphatase MutT (NUDIX family)
LTFQELKRRLPDWLAGELPGPDGQIRMSPRPRFGWRPGRIPDDARPGGVLLLLYPVGGAPHIVLTVRDPNLPQHAGQVSLPGGAAEPGESIEDAALRETHEEVGVEPAAVRTVGALSPLHVPASGFVLQPRVALTEVRPTWRPDLREVARVIEASFDELRDPALPRVETWRIGGRPVEVPFFPLSGEKVWGATAMVLSEFLCVVGSPPDPWGTGRGGGAGDGG